MKTAKIGIALMVDILEVLLESARALQKQDPIASLNANSFYSAALDLARKYPVLEPGDQQVIDTVVGEIKSCG
jgi:hypothetical protein